MKGGLTVHQMRRMALQEANEEQLDTAAASNSMSVSKYITKMQASEWGDELMLAMLSKIFRRSISIISASSVLTFHPTGQTVAAADSGAIWIAHATEWHYFGVLRSFQAKLPIEDPEMQRQQELGLLHECLRAGTQFSE